MNDLWTQSIFLRIQSFLTDACVLRDYLAEFAAMYILNPRGIRRVTTLAGLIKELERSNFSDEIGNKLRQATQPSGWLARLSSYRNLIIHLAPLALAHGQLWFWCKTINLPDGNLFPTVCFPLPGDPTAIIEARSNSEYADFERLAEQFAGPADVSSSMKDALRYAHHVIGELASLAVEFATYSPVAPLMPVITDDDLEGPIIWNRS